MFGHQHKEESNYNKDYYDQEVIRELIEVIKQLGKELKEERRYHPRVRMVLTQIVNNSKTIIMSLTLASNQKAPLQLALVDGVTLQPIIGATFTGETETMDNPAIATIDASNNLVGVSVGSANLQSVATWTYTDTTTQLPITVTLTVVTPVVVTSVVGPEGVQMVVTIGTPVAQ